MFALLLPLLASVVPEIAKWAFGSKGEEVATAATNVVKAVIGSDDPTAVARALDDPKVVNELRVQLAKIVADQEAAHEAAMLEEYKAMLSDVASARSQTVELAKTGSVIAWGAPIVSVLVLSGFVFGFWMVFHAGQGEATLAQVGMTEALKIMSVAVVSYWVGSSAGSRSKQEQITNLANLASQQVPADLVRAQQ